MRAACPRCREAWAFRLDVDVPCGQFACAQSPALRCLFAISANESKNGIRWQQLWCAESYYSELPWWHFSFPPQALRHNTMARDLIRTMGTGKGCRSFALFSLNICSIVPSLIARLQTTGARERDAVALHIVANAYLAEFSPDKPTGWIYRDVERLYRSSLSCESPPASWT